MIVIPTGDLENRAKACLKFQAISSAREVAGLVKKVALELVHVLNTTVLDRRFSREERFECVCQSILAALDDAEKVGTKLMEESIAIEKTKDALKRIEAARSFVKNQLPAILDQCLVVSDAAADGRLELREVVEIVQVASRVDWKSVFSACWCCHKEACVTAEAPVPVPVPQQRHDLLPPSPPGSPTHESPLTQPQEEPEYQEVPPLPQSSQPPEESETKLESGEVDRP